jgi:hypothetical protein
MGKKCIPGLFCIENMTLFLLIVLLILVVYFYYGKYDYSSISNNNNSVQPQQPQQPQIVIVNNTPTNSLATRHNPFNDPYSPPLKSDGLFYPMSPGIPINMQTRGLNTEYQQVGILTRSNSSNSADMILPLMGRRIMTGRDKWQYYTMTNTGNLNTKLPISLNGKSCTSEYGCDNINNGDAVYVEGYKDTFRVTMYENNLFQYIPV